MELDIPEGTPDDVKALFNRPEVLAVIEHHTKGLSSKKQELLDQLSLTKKDINDLGGLEVIKQRLSAFEKADKDAKARANDDATKSKDVEAVNKAWQEKLDEANSKIQKYEHERVQTKVASALSKALGDDAGVMDVLEPFLMKRIKTEIDVNGDVVITPLAANGGPLLTDKGNGSLKDLVNSFRDDPKFAPLFKADNKSGSNAKSTTATVSTENPFAKNTPHYSSTKQAQLYLSDPAKARQLAAAAGVKLYEPA